MLREFEMIQFIVFIICAVPVIAFYLMLMKIMEDETKRGKK